ncbi:hypothetical protein GLOTRDRAFT_126474 [Gloeophyllum trabeum ATCC 11539]|uniref:Uncharacterized protein n=1 Tax=Gloeophyllum trabeum (strain ATCC 11539 / FP-39264 / Madison 617) TaxID=670483 RepID=S7RXC7_GLOTA|nr:uncharacterized protein GLOTRDRAFT_126474 [Gloeophyllum trabeum ATCC 11539]EPQ57984.1 hypothetical protein GLOTRDRAFT_126474 [Gloeophyllum trabeum ATCC 11539]
MARFYTQYVEKATPSKARSCRSPKKSGIRFEQRSPLAHKTGQVKPKPFPPSAVRVSKVKKDREPFNLSTKKRGEEEQSMFDIYRDFGQQHEDEESEGSDEEDEFDWDEETTLVAMLQEESPSSSDSDLIALAEQLKAPMTAQGTILKQDLVQTLVPATKRVKEAHKIIEGNIDVEYGKGLLAFNEASKKVEGMCIQDEEDLKEVYVKHQTKIKDLLTQLKAAYVRRDRIFSDFQKLVDESADRACADLRSLPATVDRTINALENKSKEVFKDTGNAAKTKEKVLKGLLEKL